MRARARLGKGQELGLKESRQLMSCKGKFKHSNSRKVSRRLSLAKVANAASQVISAFDSEQQNHINEERRQWDESIVHAVEKPQESSTQFARMEWRMFGCGGTSLSSRAILTARETTWNMSMMRSFPHHSKPG